MLFYRFGSPYKSVAQHRTIMTAKPQRHFALYAVAAVAAIASPLQAQTRTDKPPASSLAPPLTQPIRFVVPNAPGGPTDTVARIVGQKLAERVGVPVVIDNRGGATGTVGGLNHNHIALRGVPGRVRVADRAGNTTTVGLSLQ